MDDPRVPPSLGAMIRELERRIRALEMQQRTRATAIKGGTLKVLSGDDDVVAEIGRLEGVTDGLSVFDTDTGTGMFHVSGVLGWATPYLGSSFRAPTEQQVITSGTFVTAYETRFEQNHSLHVRFTCGVVTDGSTAGEVRVRINGVTIGNTLVVAASHSAFHEFAAPTGGILFAGPYTLTVEGRRTSGAGSFSVFRPSDAFQGSLSPTIPVTGWIS